MRFPRLTVAVVLFGLVPCGAGSVAALDLGQWIPGLKLSPFFAERVVYESNVFQVPSGSQGDVIFKTIPGFLADFTFGPHSATLGYRAEILKYVTLTSQDTVNHIGVAQLRLDFPKLFFNLRDDFTHTSDPPNTELTGPIASDNNVLAPEAEYRITSRLSAGVNYAWTHVSFADPEVAVDLDRNEQLIGASAFWRVSPRPTSGSISTTGSRPSASRATGTSRGSSSSRRSGVRSPPSSRRPSASGSSGASPTRRFSRATSD